MPQRPAPLQSAVPLAPRRPWAGLGMAAAVSLAALLAGWTAQAQAQGGLILRSSVAQEADDTAAPAQLAQADAEETEEAQDDGAGESDSLFDDPIDGAPADDLLADPLLADDLLADDVFADAPPVEPRAPSTRRARQQAAADAAQPVGQRPRGDASEEDPPRPGAAPNARAAAERLDAEEADAADDAAALGPPGARTLREPPVEALPRVDALETDPFAPLGIRAGAFVLRPSFETGITASSNATRTPQGSADALSESTLRLDAESDWAEHSAVLGAVGTARKSLSGDEVREVEGAVNADLVFDLGHDWQARAGAAYTIQPESPSDPEGVSNASEQPLNQSFEARAGLDKALGPLRLAATASVERGWFGEAELEEGGTVDQSGRDSTLGLVTLRAGYALSPAVLPFVEVESGRRLYDEDGDRSATRLGARAGVALDLREKWTGEIAAGWLRESFDADDFEPIEGPSLSANLRWSPVRGTTVGLLATTSVEGSTTEGESGSLIQDLRLDVERTLRANLSAEAALGLSYRDYIGSDGRDLTLIGELGLTWWLNRRLGLSGRLRHERLDSNLAGRDYEENSVFLGTRFQY